MLALPRNLACSALASIVVTLAAATLPAIAQSFNIDMGAPDSAPSDSYGAAANQPGYWNTLIGNDSEPAYLYDINIIPTNVAYVPALPFGISSFDHPLTTGDDQNLLDDYFDLGQVPHTDEFTGLYPGLYTVYVYGWGPDNIHYRTVVVVNDGEPVLVGGEWPGGLVEGVIYARLDAVVQPGESLRIFMNGLTDGMSSRRGTLNGIQIVFRAPFGRGDASCDGAVDFFDIDPFLTALFDSTAYQQTYCGGSFATVDTDCSADVDFFDIDPFLACLFGECPPCP